MAHRHQQLEDSLRLHQFIHDKEDELRWVREREPLASSSALGNSLTTVQSLLKKHQVIIHNTPSLKGTDQNCLPFQAKFSWVTSQFNISDNYSIYGLSNSIVLCKT